jgi:hypothetical protein
MDNPVVQPFYLKRLEIIPVARMKRDTELMQFFNHLVSCTTLSGCVATGYVRPKISFGQKILLVHQ